MSNYNSSINLNQQLTSVDLCSNVNIRGIYNNGPTNTGVGATLTITPSPLSIDFSSVILNQRILLAAQTNPIENGIYIVSAINRINVGFEVITQTILTRAIDFQCAQQIKPGYYIIVGSGKYCKSFIFVVNSFISQIGFDQIPFSTKSIASGVSPSFAGGSSSHNFIIEPLTPNSKITANISASTNSVGIAKIQPVLGKLTITFTSDPGPNTTLYWMGSLF